MKAVGHQDAFDSYKAYAAAFIYPQSMRRDPTNIIGSCIYHSVKTDDLFHTQVRKAERATAAKLIEADLSIPFYATRKNVLRLKQRGETVVSDTLFTRFLVNNNPTHVPSAWLWTPGGWEACELMRRDLVRHSFGPLSNPELNLNETLNSKILGRYFDHQIVVRRTEAQAYDGANWMTAMRRLGTHAARGRAGRKEEPKKEEISWTKYCREVISLNQEARLGRI